MPALRGRELSLAVLSVAVSLGLSEAGARLLLDPPRFHRRAPYVEYDGQLGHRGVAGYREELSSASGDYVFALNDAGFRDPPLPRGGAAPGTTRVVFLGDSFLVGRSLPGEALLTSLVRRELARGGPRAEVANLSVIDYGTGQELLLLERWAELEPDAVVLALYPGNDVANNAIGLAGRTRVSPGDLVRPYVTPEGGALRTTYVQPVRAWMRRHSRLLATFERGLLSLRPGFGLQRETTPAAERLRLGRAPREHLELFRRHDPAHPWEVAWSATEALLTALRDRCAQRGARLLVVVIPTIEQVQRTARSIEIDIEARRYAGLPIESLLDWNLPERRLDAFFRREGIEARLLLGTLREAAATEADVYTADAHLGATGHRLAADAVVRWLRGEAPRTAHAPIAGSPTRRLPNADTAAPVLDFRSDPHRDHLAGGWIAWHPAGGSEPWGWRTAPRAELVLPARSGALVVRGWIPPETPLPLELRIRGVGFHRVFVHERGAFEVRIPDGALARPRSSEGYVALQIATGETRQRGGAPQGILIRTVGFEDAGEDSP